MRLIFCDSAFKIARSAALRATIEESDEIISWRPRVVEFLLVWEIKFWAYLPKNAWREKQFRAFPSFPAWRSCSNDKFCTHFDKLHHTPPPTALPSMRVYSVSVSFNTLIPLPICTNRHGKNQLLTTFTRLRLWLCMLPNHLYLSKIDFISMPSDSEA